MFVDYAKIFIKAGNGGMGAVSFHREKYVSKGGPDGGDGGSGGDIVFIVNQNMRTLMDFRLKKHFRAENGKDGGAKNSTGATGKDTIIEVPPGTVIRDAQTNEILVDMLGRTEKVVLMQGGKGGKGNAMFASSSRQAPTIAQPGGKTTEREVILELKTIADIGLVGFPNVGKSTILSVVTNARPKIANYHFTTLEPNLGVLRFYDQSYLVADIPGLIEGAHEGAGLGHRFLRHVERTRLLIHVVDISGIEDRDPIEDFKQINSELAMYSEVLASRPQIIVANKVDIMENTDNLDRLKDFAEAQGMEVFPVSAATHDGFEPLLARAVEMLAEMPIPQPITDEIKPYTEEPTDKYYISRSDDAAFVVDGPFVDDLIGRVNFDDDQSFMYFQRVLKEKGIIKELVKRGAKEGSLIRVGDIEFDFVE
jgi:GTP-binding protein